MRPERWQKIDQVFHSTLECPSPERSNFLSQACSGDDDLRHEVETLVRAHERDGDFLDSPAYDVSTEFFADCFVGLLVGQHIGPYKILSALGIGGMGEVYLAQDSRLGRKIALKLLSPDFARDYRRVRRFEQEARAASALSHPNVCVIHEIAETKDGRHFIAMEYIDGITLRERIVHEPLKLGEVLTIGEQIAAALAAAHAAGVVHRDIKPENIMLRKDGYVKVLDFGLAKLNQTDSPTGASALSPVLTEPGTQMGTVKYMSPEQLREGLVDERTDVWSLGVVLHEMVTGITPFEAPSRNEIIASILRRRPARLAFDARAVPEEFQRLVARALSKKLEGRYQTINGLANDLKSLHRQELATPAELPLPLQRSHGAESKPRVSRKVSQKARVSNRPQSQVSTSVLWTSALIYLSSTAERFGKRVQKHPMIAVLAVLMTALAIFVGVNPYRFVGQNPPDMRKARMMIALTSSGTSVCAAISSDAKYAAHVEEKNGLQELRLTSIATTRSSGLVDRGKFIYRGITFSHDGTYLYFTRSEESEVASLYQVALPDGSPRQIVQGVDSPVAFSPSGDRLAFVRFKRAIGEYSLVVANVDGTDERTIATRRDGNRFSLDGTAWSPDGKTIVCGSGWWDRGYHMNLVEVDVMAGQEKPVQGQHQWFAIYQTAWLNDKSGLIISAREQTLGPSQLWQISYPQGNSSRITNDTMDYRGVSVSRDGNTIVSVQSRQNSQIWVARSNDLPNARAITSKVGRSFGLGLSWTREGRIVFSSMSGNNLNISMVDADGFNQTNLTASAGDNYTPAVSAEEGLIVFSSNRGGSFNLWRMNFDGGGLEQLTFTDGNFYPSVSPDGQWVFYENQTNATPTVWKVSTHGGQAVPITDGYARMPIVSSDGQFIACRYYVEPDRRGIAIIPTAGGPPIEVLPIPIKDWQRVQWLSGSRVLAYLDTVNGVSNIWSYDLNDRSKKQLTDFKADEIFSYAWSTDFRQLAWERGAKLSDVTVINHDQP